MDLSEIQISSGDFVEDCEKEVNLPEQMLEAGSTMMQEGIER